MFGSLESKAHEKNSGKMLFLKKTLSIFSNRFYVKYVAAAEHMVRQKLGLVLLWDVLHNLLLVGFFLFCFLFSNTDHWDFPEKQITSVKKRKGVYC